MGILNRCGLSWDVMASRQDQTRQALHRRLATRADDLMRQAVEFEDLHMLQIEEHVDALAQVAGDESLQELAEPEEFFGEMAEELTEARKHSRWWEWWWWYRHAQTDPDEKTCDLAPPTCSRRRYLVSPS